MEFSALRRLRRAMMDRVRFVVSWVFDAPMFIADLMLLWPLLVLGALAVVAGVMAVRAQHDAALDDESKRRKWAGFRWMGRRK